MKALKQLQQLMNDHKKIVFFGGAGVSTASGIPDFRSSSGLYQESGYKYSPEVMVSHTFYRRHPEEFFDFYKSKMIFLGAKPNAAHDKLAELEQAGTLLGVVTQNIDGLHQRAGSKKVLELHGSVHRNYCEACGKFYDAAYVVKSAGVPLCPCGGRIKPDVVLYEEQLDNQVVSDTYGVLQQADLLLIGGTSLTVYPAAGFVQQFKGDKVVIINKTPTPQDEQADLVVAGDIAALFAQIKVG